MGLLFGMGLNPVFAQDGSSEALGPAVRTVVEDKGEAQVVVALAEPSPTGEKGVQRKEIQRTQTDVLSAVSASEFQTTHRYAAVPALAGTITSAAALDRLAQHPSVRRIDLDAGGTGGLDTSVEIIRADQWHEEDVTGTGTTVAILDSGIDTDHDDLADDLAHEACFLNVDGEGQCPDGTDRQTGPGAAEDDHGHGTSVAGIITSRGVRAPRGVAPNTEIVAVKVLNSNNRFSSFSEIVAALDYLIETPELGVQVVNMSLGTDAQFSTECDNTTAWNMAGASAVNTLRSEGTVVVASSMNKGSATEMASPACLNGVVSVGATDGEDDVAGFTNSNQFLDLMAPGVDIQTSARGNGTTSFGGTSAAAPHAVGCAALLLDAGTDSTASEIAASLRTSPVQVTDPKNNLTFPRLDCYTARERVAIAEVSATPAQEVGANAPTVPFALRWQTTRERDSEGFRIERRTGPPPSQTREEAEDGWTQVGFVASKAPNGAADDTLRYRFDGNVPTPGQYAFRLRHVTEEGPDDGQLVGAATGLEVPIGGAYALGGPQPNPSQGTAEIEVVVERTQEVRVVLYDALGRVVQVLYDNSLQAKRPLLLRTEQRELASGTYFLRVRGEAFAATRRMTIVR